MGWRRRTPTIARTDAAMKEYISAHLARTKDHRESVSYMVSCLRNDGIRFPTGHTFAMDEFERLGYKMESDRNEWGAMLRTYVKEAA